MRGSGHHQEWALVLAMGAMGDPECRRHGSREYSRKESPKIPSATSWQDLERGEWETGRLTRSYLDGNDESWSLTAAVAIPVLCA